MRKANVLVLPESNSGQDSLDHLVLEFSADPPFLEPKNWRIDSLLAGTTLHITDRDVRLNASFWRI